MNKASYTIAIVLGWVALMLITTEITHAYSQSGIASYYWQPQKVASGGNFNPNAMTAAHKTLPFGTKVRVTHSKTGSSVVVTINDRGPFIKGRIIDLSLKAATQLGIRDAGIAAVKIEAIGKGAIKHLAKQTKPTKNPEPNPKKLVASKSKEKNSKKKNPQKLAKTSSKNSSKSAPKQQQVKSTPTVQVAEVSTTSPRLDIEELINR